VYNELVQIQVFIEFIKDIQEGDITTPNLTKVLGNRSTQRLNKIRNAIAHFDWTLNGDKVNFKDKNYEREESCLEISEFCSLLAMIAIFMTTNINNVD
jgi:hypothetical protein